MNTIGCSVPQSFTSFIREHCHLWGSDGSRQQMLFIYLLRITPETLTLHYFNDSYSSQMNSSRYQLCAANNNLEIVEMITDLEDCMQNYPEDSGCCNDFNISINFNEGKMEVHFPHGFIEIPVGYLDCTSKLSPSYIFHNLVSHNRCIYIYRSDDSSNSTHKQFHLQLLKYFT